MSGASGSLSQLAGPFQDASEAVRWGSRHLAPAVSDMSLAQREARWLLEAAAVAAGRDPLFIRQPELTQRVASVFRSHVARRSRGEPLAYVMGEASFRGLDLIVTPDVLIPRPETEQLADLVLKNLPHAEQSVLDMGTGSGALAVALAVERPTWRLTSVDISASAVAIAQRNITRHGVGNRVTVIEGDLWPPGIPLEEKFDAVVANLPYVGADEVLPADVADWEPRGALRAGKTGAEIIERAIETAEKVCCGSALGFFEIGETQRPHFERRYGDRFAFHEDLAGRIRFMTGRL